MTSDPDRFYEPRLRFEIRKPTNWRFVPPAWSPIAQLKNVSDPDAWVQYANLPFVSMMGSHRSPRHAYPTVQATCRPFQARGAGALKRLLETQIAFLAEQFDQLEVLRQTAEATVGGCRAVHARYRYLLPLQRGTDEWMEAVLARSYVLLAPGLAFIIGMASSANEQYFSESDFQGVLSSLRIGASAQQGDGADERRPG